MESVSLYSEAKNEYLKQLSSWITPSLVEFFRKEYGVGSTRVGAKKAMNEFQEFCSTVPRWNQDVIDTNIGIILDNCRCDYVEELMTAVFIAHTKMLTAIRVNGKQKKLQITLPKFDHFLHRVFTECARAFWKAPFLFSEEYSPVERQKNVLQAEAMCMDALSSAVRGLLPVKTILRDYLDDDEEEEVISGSLHSLENVAAETLPVVAPTTEASPSTPVVVAPTTEASPPTPVVVAPTTEASSPTPVVVAPTTEASPPPVVVAPTTEALPFVAVESTPVSVIETTQSIATNPTTKGSHSVKIDKINSLPSPALPTESSHSVSTILDTRSSTVEKVDEPIVRIDTEHSVHFTPYDTVYDERNAEISEIRYTPKVSVEDKAPRLSFGSSSTGIDLNDITELEPAMDIDADLTATGDFETLG